jgi:hypothetical protein
MPVSSDFIDFVRDLLASLEPMRIKKTGDDFVYQFRELRYLIKSILFAGVL